MSARPLPMPTNPALLRHAEQRRKSLENRIADRITRFAGSMLLGVELYPLRNCCACPTRSWSSTRPSTQLWQQTEGGHVTEGRVIADTALAFQRPT